jgi:hypothetical protein
MPQNLPKPTQTLDIDLIREVLRRNRVKDNNLITSFFAKRFLKQKIFSKAAIPLTNIKLKNGQYKAYTHQSMLASFSSAIEKLHLEARSKIICHPLLPVELVDYLIAEKYEVVPLAISEDTLTTSLDLIKPSLAGSNLFASLSSSSPVTPASLYILYSFTDLYNEVIDCVKAIEEAGSKTLVLDLNPFVTSEFYKLIDELTEGAYIQLTGPSIAPYILNKTLGIELDNTDLYVSWVYSNDLATAFTIEELDNYDLQQEFLDMYLFYLDKANPIKGGLSKFKNFFVNNVIHLKDYELAYTPKKTKGQKRYKKEFNLDLFKADFLEKYEQISKQALPDYWLELYFTLNLELNNWIDKELGQMEVHIQDNLNSLRMLTKTFQNLYPDLNIKYPNLEGRLPCAFFLYTKDINAVYTLYLNSSIDMYKLPDMHTKFASNPYLLGILSGCLVKKF